MTEERKLPDEEAAHQGARTMELRHDEPSDAQWVEHLNGQVQTLLSEKEQLRNEVERLRRKLDASSDC